METTPTLSRVDVRIVLASLDLVTVLTSSKKFEMLGRCWPSASNSW